MPEYLIESSQLKLVVSDIGAEIVELLVKGSSHNWIWSASSPWKRRAPILFPIVGKLKENRFVHKNRVYSLPQHGFARDIAFDFEFISSSEFRFSLKSNKLTLEMYPFDFLLTVHYSVRETKVLVRYTVKNIGQELMYYNLGWHPGFVLPNHDVCKIRISSPNYFGRCHMLSDGLLDLSSHTDLTKNIVDIASDSFVRDAWVLIDGVHQEMCLLNENGDAISVRSNAPRWGIWSNAPDKFICIEPWWGVADFKNATGILSEKWGIQCLTPGNEWKCSVELELSPKSF